MVEQRLRACLKTPCHPLTRLEGTRLEGTRVAVRSWMYMHEAAPVAIKRAAGHAVEHAVEVGAVEQHCMQCR